MKNPHAVVFPIPLQGHINPMMALADRLKSSGIRITFLLTERTFSIFQKNSNCKCGMARATHKDCNNKYHGSIHCNDMPHESVQCSKTCMFFREGECCFSSCKKSSSPFIGVETIPDSAGPGDESLPMTSSAAFLFLNSTPLIRRRVEEILRELEEGGEPATCMISDSFVPWTQDVATKFGIPRMEFWASSATVYSMGFHIPHLIDAGYLPIRTGTSHEFCMDIIPSLAPFKLADFFCTHAIASPTFDLVQNAFSRARESQCILVNSFYSLEKDIIDALRHEEVPIEPIGPLIPLHTCGSHLIRSEGVKETHRVASTSLCVDDNDILMWLDKQVEKSVMYVSFGSMASLGQDDIQELIFGLEASHQPYLLVIKADVVQEGNIISIATQGRGFLCHWAPQARVLAHPAVAGFLTHCGWNSIMEGMCMGVPMIGCPRESDQHTNMKCLRDEWKVAIELGRLEKHCYGQTKRCHCNGDELTTTNKVKIKRDLVEGAVRALMHEEIGIALRTRIHHLQCASQHAVHVNATTLHSLFKEPPSNHKDLNG